MPHINVKLFTGRSEQDKKRLADRIALAVMNSIGASESSISVAIEDVDPDEWTEKVYDPEIAGSPSLIYKKPGYERF
ncbi:MAG: tautomerase family protein [Burkholderiaceae bacterium]